jgi:acetyl esterase
MVGVARRHDFTAWTLGIRPPRYGRTLYFAGRDLPAPRRTTIGTRHGSVPCLEYAGTRAGVYLHFHGGAFVMRHPRMDDFWARFVVATTGLTVVLADYSVAPRVRYPVAHDQACDIASALTSAGPVGVGGFSAGGNLAAAVTLRLANAEPNLRSQLLGVPSLDVAGDVSAKAARAPGSAVTASTLRLVRATYFRDETRRGEPDASPLLAPTLAGLPPTLIVTAQLDTLREEGIAYAGRLRQAGVDVRHIDVPMVDHYFLNGLPRTAAHTLMTELATWLDQTIR